MWFVSSGLGMGIDLDREFESFVLGGWGDVVAKQHYQTKMDQLGGSRCSSHAMSDGSDVKVVVHRKVSRVVQLRTSKAVAEVPESMQLVNFTVVEL